MKARPVRRRGPYTEPVTGSWALVVPLALGAAVSPAMITLQLLILSSGAKSVSRAWGFALGMLLTIAAFIVLVATVARGLTLGGASQSVTERVVKLLAAALLVLLGIRALRRPAGSGATQRVKNMTAKDPWSAFVLLGFVSMWLNLSSLVLMLPAVHVSVTAGTDVEAQLLFIALCAVAPGLLPVLAATLLGKRADSVLGTLNRFTTDHANQINAGICFLFSALLVWSAAR